MEQGLSKIAKERLTNPMATQVAGDHYKNMKIQPIEFIQANNLGFIQGNIVKYATRYPHKGCPVDDLRKIIHYAQLALQIEFDEV